MARGKKGKKDESGGASDAADSVKYDNPLTETASTDASDDGPVVSGTGFTHRRICSSRRAAGAGVGAGDAGMQRLLGMLALALLLLTASSAAAAYAAAAYAASAAGAGIDSAADLLLCCRRHHCRYAGAGEWNSQKKRDFSRKGEGKGRPTRCSAQKLGRCASARGGARWR